MASEIVQFNNPKRDYAGRSDLDITLIDSGLDIDSGVVYYEIRRYDQVGSTIKLNTGMSAAVLAKMAHMVVLATISPTDTSALAIILEFRTKYQYRVAQGAAPTGDWLGDSTHPWFKTRDKKYSTPDEINQLSDANEGANATKKTSITTDVVNEANTTATNSGATITNNIAANFADVVAYYKTSRGATILTSNGSALLD